MKRWIFAIVVVATLAGLIVWRYHGKQSDLAAQKQAVVARTKAAPNVTVAPAVQRDVVHTYVAVGSIESAFNVKISSKVTGLVTFLQKREGDPVKQGEVLARIDPTQVQAQLSQAQADVAAAQSRLAQAQITENPTNVQVTTQIQQQMAALTSAKASLNQVTQNYAAQVQAAKAAVTDAEGRVQNALSAIANAQAGIGSAQANLTNAKSKQERTNSLFKQGFVSAQDLDDTTTAVQVQVAAVDVARSQLNGAQASRDSALAQKDAAQQQLEIAITKGKADIDAAKAIVDQATASLKYAQSNTAQTPAYKQNLAALRAAVDAAKAQARNLQSQLSDTILVSSVNGYVTARNVDPGSVVTAGLPLLSVQTIKQVFMSVAVPEEVSHPIHQGQTATAVLDALPGRTFTGLITQINPAADLQSRQFMVRITIDNPHDVIKPGMFGRATLVTERVPNATMVPREAVTNGKNGATVAVVDGQNVAHRVPVKIGTDDINEVQILQGVQPGDNVVTLSGAPLKDGVTVHVNPTLKVGETLTPAVAQTPARAAGSSAQ